MKIHTIKTELPSILRFRKMFLQENNFQIRYDACHARNWSDSYLVFVDGKEVGYGSVKGKRELSDRDAIFEFYVLPAYKNKASQIFTNLLQSTKATYIECQSNDKLLSSMMFEFANKIQSKVILFENHQLTNLVQEGLVFRRRKPDDVDWKNGKEAGEFVLIKDNKIIADGGFLTHYNIPFADLYMAVSSEYRRQGFGSFILQEIKKECYLAGRVPAARCNISNVGSKMTLQKAGMKVCGYMLLGKAS